MKAPVIIIGIGEMGGTFARGFLRLGHPVYPATRNTDLAALSRQIEAPAVVLVAVAETDLQAVLKQIPPGWKSQLALLQNELLPRDFAHLDDPTVISVWFEKKPGQDARVIIPSPVFGPNAQLLHDALGAINIPVRMLATSEQLEFELVVKNLYILTTNIAGLITGGTTGTLWNRHQQLAREVAADVIALQQAMTGHDYDQQALINAMVSAIDGDTEHQCMGRSAPSRLQRALRHADNFKLPVPALRRILSQLAQPEASA
ncbi:MAG: hypothetical protein ABFR19_04325 [Pseudomonadota bacterium]